jgi:Bacterial Ig-like domain (group 1)
MRSLCPLSLVLLAGAVLALPACSDSNGPKTGPAAHVDIVSGNTQTGAANTQLSQPLVVKVTDAAGNVVKGQAVSFVVTAGGGQVSAGTATTDQAGMAQTLWTLGGVAGSPQTLEARAVGGTGQVLASAAFTATATAGAPTQATPYGSITSGDTLVAGVVGAPVEDSFAVVVRDAAGNPVPGVQVAWAVTSGGGSITSPTTTDASGVARTQWVLGTATGPQTAQATVGGATVRFTAYPATTLTKTSGDGVTAGTGSTLTVSLSATGPSGAIGGLPIHWTVSSGGGSVAPAVGETSRHAFNLGTASASWTLGPSAGTQTLTASAGGLSVTFTATAISAGTRTLLVQVPGRVLDATSDRVLWLESGTGLVKVRTLATGTDQALMTTSGPTTVVGYLFSSGAMVYSGAGLFEFRGGVTTNLGSVFGIPSFEGDWAAWSDGAQVIRRDLATGTNLVIYGNRGFSVDAGADGDVVFTGRYYHDGTLTQVTTQGPSSGILTDGVNVVYSGYDAISVKAFLDNGDADVLLFSSPNGGALRLNAGWVAWSTPGTPVTRRSPAGVVEQVSPESSGTLVDALRPDGTVVYRYPRNGGRFYLVTPAGTRYDLGPAGDNDTVVVHGSSFFLLSGGSAYRLAP